MTDDENIQRLLRSAPRQTGLGEDGTSVGILVSDVPLDQQAVVHAWVGRNGGKLADEEEVRLPAEGSAQLAAEQATRGGRWLIPREALGLPAEP